MRRLAPQPSGPNPLLGTVIGAIGTGISVGRRIGLWGNDPPPGSVPTPGVGGWIQRTLPGGKTGYQVPGHPMPVPPPVPTPGVGGVIQRTLPGGKTGYQHTMMDTGFSGVVSPAYEQRMKCPKGYVAVDIDGDGVNDACMWKPMARSLKLWSSRPKPPVSGWDARAIKRAAGAKKRVKKLASSVGYTTTERGRGRGGSRSCGCRGKCKCK